MPDKVEHEERRREALRAEVQMDLAAAETYAEQHGSFADFVREHYERGGAAVSDWRQRPR